MKIFLLVILKIIKGCSHNVHLEKPDEFNTIVSEFLKKKMIGIG